MFLNTKMKSIILWTLCLRVRGKLEFSCPNTSDTWEAAEKTVHCSRGKFYHCLLDENKRTIQACLDRSWVEQGNCPEYDSFADKIDVFPCPISRSGCPGTTFWTNQPYMFPACLNQKYKEDEKDLPIEENGGNKGSKGGLNINIIIIVACSSLLLVVTVTIVLCFVFRKKKEENATNEVELATLFNSSARNDKSQYKTGIKNPEEPLLNKRDVSIYPDRYSKTEDDGTGVQMLPPLERYPQKLSTAEKSRSLIENHLRKPGDRLVLVASLASAIDTFELELKTREPGYIKVDSFGDWSNVSEREGCTVLLSCIMKACRDASIIRHRRELENIAKEGGKLKLIIPVQEDVFDIEKHNLSNLQLFQKIAYHRIA